MKDLIRRVAKHKAVITNTVVQGGDLGHAYVEGQWEMSEDLYSHLKSKTAAGTEAKTIVTCAEREGGFEAWRHRRRLRSLGRSKASPPVSSLNPRPPGLI